MPHDDGTGSRIELSRFAIVIGLGVILLIAVVVVLPQFFDGNSATDVAEESTRSLPDETDDVDIDALKKEGLELLRQKDETGLGPRLQKRLDYIVEQYYPKLPELYAQEKAGRDQTARQAAVLSPSEQAKRRVEKLWAEYDGSPLSKAVLLTHAVPQLEEFLGNKDYLNDGKSPEACARHFSALVSWFGPAEAKLYDFTGTKAAADPENPDDLKERWHRCKAAVRNPTLVALWQAEVEYCYSIGYKPAFSAADDPHHQDRRRVSFAGFDVDWKIEKDYCLKWLEFDTSVYED